MSYWALTWLASSCYSSTYWDVNNSIINWQKSSTFGNISMSNMLISWDSNDIMVTNLFDMRGQKFWNYAKNRINNIYLTTIRDMWEFSWNVISNIQWCNIYMWNSSWVYANQIWDINSVNINWWTTTSPYLKLIRSCVIWQIVNWTITEEFAWNSWGSVNLLALVHNYAISNTVFSWWLVKNLSTVANMWSGSISKQCYSSAQASNYKNFVTQYDYTTQEMITTIV